MISPLSACLVLGLQPILFYFLLAFGYTKVKREGRMAKSGLVKLIMKILGKSMAYVSKNDARARDTFLNLPENLRISMGIFGEGMSPFKKPKIKFM